MMENRCIEVLKKMKHMFTETCAKIDENTALDMAVEALSEVGQYRATGLTPSMVHDLIKSCKAHEKNALENAHIVDEYRAIGTVEEFAYAKRKVHIAELATEHIDKMEKTLKDYEAIGTIEELRELKEKAEPKKVDDDYCCPVCHTYAKDDEGVAGEYCPNCGQHLDWE